MTLPHADLTEPLGLAPAPDLDASVTGLSQSIALATVHLDAAKDQLRYAADLDTDAREGWTAGADVAARVARERAARSYARAVEALNGGQS